jgi:hypothetical protein
LGYAINEIGDFIGVQGFWIRMMIYCYFTRLKRRIWLDLTNAYLPGSGRRGNITDVKWV